LTQQLEFGKLLPVVDSTIRVWETATGKELQSIGKHDGIISMIKYSNNHEFIVSSGWDAKIKVWNAENYNLMKTISDEYEITSFDITNNDKYIIFCSFDFFFLTNFLKICDLSSGEIVHNFELQDAESINYVRFSPDQKFVVTAGDNKVINFRKNPLEQ